MIASLRSKEAVKRVSFKIPFVLGKDLSIGIVGCVLSPLIVQALERFGTDAGVHAGTTSSARRQSACRPRSTCRPPRASRSSPRPSTRTRCVPLSLSSLASLHAEDSHAQDTGALLDRKSEVKKYFQVGRADIERGTQASKLFFSDADIRKVKVRPISARSSAHSCPRPGSTPTS